MKMLLMCLTAMVIYLKCSLAFMNNETLEEDDFCYSYVDFLRTFSKLTDRFLKFYEYFEISNRQLIFLI